jgi:hypothetical protein
MSLFDRSASKLSGKTTLLLTADPGNALLDAARLYDAEVRHWHGRLVFRNGVLLFGPVTLTPKIEQQAGLPAGFALAWYTGAAIQRHSEERTHMAKQEDGDRLVRGLADRLGGTTYPAHLQPELALLASVYSEQGLSVEQVIEALELYGGELRVEDEKPDSYGMTGKDASFYVGYFGPRLYLEREAPPAVGAMRSTPLHHWDINTGIRASKAASELSLKVGEAALALASRSGGVALDMLGFRISSAQELLPR